MTFQFEISTLPLVLAGTLAVMTVLLVTVCRARIRAAVRCRRRLEQEREAMKPATEATPVSIVVYARDNSRRLETLLAQLMVQEYPAPYEVIVVNDSSGYDCADVVTRMAVNHTNLRMTFVPERAHNLSRKKLALTLGLKAARHPYVLLLNAECSLTSHHWLAGMAADPGRVTLGQAVITSDDGKPLPMMMRLDEACTAITWIDAAERGHAYRGNGYNLGYLVATFFENDGFSGSLNLHAGDDDLFINKIATADNTRVELTADTLVAVTTSRPRELYAELKRSHIFTARHLPSHPLVGIIVLLLWLSAGVAAATIWLMWPDVAWSAVALALLMIQWAVIGASFHRATRAVGAAVNGWIALPTVMLLPLHRLRYRLAAYRNRSGHYTWQRSRTQTHKNL